MALIKPLGLLGLILVLTPLCPASTVYYLATGTNAANNTINVSNPAFWLFTPTTAFDFGGGLFSMKAGSKASADLTFTLYQGTNATGISLATVTLTNTEFCAQTSCSNPGDHQFFFTNSVPLSVGVDYFAELTTLADTKQNDGYDIKSGDQFVSDQSGNVVDSPITTPGAVPEPGTLLLSALSVAGCWIWRRRAAIG